MRSAQKMATSITAFSSNILQRFYHSATMDFLDYTCKKVGFSVESLDLHRVNKKKHYLTREEADRRNITDSDITTIFINPETDE